MKIYRQIVRDLSQVYPDGEARALARWLCEECFHLTQSDLLLDKDNHLSADDLAKSQEIVQRLLRHEPIQYILGHTNFCGHNFMIAPGALIPRPETEQLVSLILSELPSVTSILDVGTGSGCIALSLALALPEVEVTGWDVSPEALNIACSNGKRYPEARVHFEQADILEPPADDQMLDVIVSNPPYVCQSEAAMMERNVLDYEPRQALFVPDSDPLLFYRAISCYAKTHLRDGGQLWFEINQAFGAETAHLIEENGFSNVRVIRDDFGHDRFVNGVFFGNSL